MQDALGSVQSILVLGATSDIAQATLQRIVNTHTKHVILAARNPEALETETKELQRLGARDVHTVPFDATDYASHDAFVDNVFATAGDIDLVLIAFGVLGDQASAELDGAETRSILETNFVGAASVAAPLVRRLHAQGHGAIVALSSVAGERARRSNYIYGSSKAGFDAYFQGLGDRLQGSGVRVMVVRPGFVRTKMTAGMKAAPLATTPEAVADAIVSGLRHKRETIWVPGTLRYVMSVLRHMPRAIFRRLPI
jgi:decaprenylphospho-beta-D-erythro-pentofuranosid-2-ulose 2-reductase